jgi:hypothetical protein
VLWSRAACEFRQRAKDEDDRVHLLRLLSSLAPFAARRIRQ